MTDREQGACAGPVDLNEAQRRAVEHEGSPLIVLAGPGTGKTRVITERVAHLVDEGAGRGLRPESVVALTFSVKAAEEMRARLAERVGGGRADRVAAMTFHGFGWKLLHRFADMLGLPGEIQLLDSAQQREMVRELILEHGLFPGYAAQGPGVLVDEVNRHLEFLANHAVTPERAMKEAAAWRERVGEAQGGNGGAAAGGGEAADRPGPDEEAERLRCAWFGDLARLNELLTARRRDLGRLAFSDLISEPIRLLREHEIARAICHAEFRCFVVDEFQDVNAAQIELLRSLAPPKLGRDVCVVGDDDQSIYAFRGADELAFERFRSIWSDAETIALTKNYRSTGAIVGVANHTISLARRRFAPDKVIEAAGGRAAPGPDVECVGLDHYGHDGEVIAAMIRAAVAVHPDRPLSSFAVVARNNGDLDRIAGALGLEGIPVRLLRARSPRDDEGVKDVMNWIEVLIDPSAEWAARRLLLRPPFSADVDEVVRWGREFRALRSRGLVAGKVRGAARNFVRFLATRAEDHPAAKRFAELHAKLRAIDGHKTADETIFRIITLADIAHADLASAPERAVRVANLVALLRFARQRQDRLPAPGDLRMFRAYYNDLNDDEQRLQSIGENSIDSSFDESAPLAAVDDVQPAAGGEAGEQGAVHLLTAHGAKGLEFDTVFVPRVMPRAGYGSTRSEEPLNVPAGLGAVDDGRDWKSRQQDEERRVFYVACTRAERRLVLLSQRQKSSTSMHLWREIAVPPRKHVSVVTGEEVMSAAIKAGVLAHLGDAISAEAADFGARKTRDDAAAKQRTAARLEAVRGLALAESGEGAEAASAAMRLAAARMAVAGLVQRGESPPAWMRDAFPALAEEAERILARVASRDAEPATIGAVIRRMAMEAGPIEPPLHLSFSAVSAYLNCPRCYFLKQILRLEDRPYAQRDIGNVVHEALERFYREWRDADADGRTRPGLKELEELGQRTFFRKWPKSDPVDDAQMKQVKAQLRLAYEQLHSDHDHVVDVELKLEAPYECDGRRHTLVAKIDRVDQLAETGGWRIIDYKTGKARKELLEPGNRDLQMGIYALALSHHLRAGPEALPLFEGEPDVVSGVAEYWLLSTGQRGRLSLSEIDYEAIRSSIDRAVRGILAGEFEQKGEKCYGDCEFLGA